MAKNLLAKVINWGKEEVKNKMGAVEYKEMLEVHKYPRRQVSVLSEAWRKVRKDRGKIRRNVGYNILKEDYWDLTEKVEVNVEEGMKRKRKEINDEEMTRNIIEKYELDNGNMKIIYTDSSKMKGGQAVAAAIVEEEQEEGHYVSMDKKCSIFIAEVFAITKLFRRTRRKTGLDHIYCVTWQS